MTATEPRDGQTGPTGGEAVEEDATVEEAIAILDGDAVPDVGALQVLRRGLQISPELRNGLRVTVAVALIAAVGKLVIPITIQQVIDRGLLGPSGYRPGFV